MYSVLFILIGIVSTHSRPKAAGRLQADMAKLARCFNTQPPEGGWQILYIAGFGVILFQHTAARRRLAMVCVFVGAAVLFQHTAARRRLVNHVAIAAAVTGVSTHSRPKAAGCLGIHPLGFCFVSTHSRPKAAGTVERFCKAASFVSTHSRPKAAGSSALIGPYGVSGFQHTAARRRLGATSRFKAKQSSFNTQPPEGGWTSPFSEQANMSGFQHTAARRRLDKMICCPSTS